MVRYYDDSLNDEEARFPLWRSDSDLSGSGRDERRASKGNMNRILLIISLALLVIISVYFQYSQMKLSQQLSSDEEQLKKLQQTVKDQTLVINRFNSSVTNSDVVKRLTTLEYTLETNTKELHEELDRTIADVNYKLNSTMSSLEQTVEKAENEIASRVETVKKDYEEFERKTNDQFSMENSFMIWQLAGTFTLLSCLISSWHMGAHFRNLEQPIIQRKILAILWMSPIYAITSWVSLVFPQLEGYAAILKDSYEGYIIYQVSQIFSDWFVLITTRQMGLTLRRCCLHYSFCHFVFPSWGKEIEKESSVYWQSVLITYLLQLAVEHYFSVAFAVANHPVTKVMKPWLVRF